MAELKIEDPKENNKVGLFAFALPVILAVGLVASTYSAPATSTEKPRLWCVSNYIENEPLELTPQGLPRQDKLLDGKESWIRRDQVEAYSKNEAETFVINKYNDFFARSNKTELREALAKNDKDFFLHHFNGATAESSGATAEGKCLGMGESGIDDGKWVSDAQLEECFGIKTAPVGPSSGGISSGNCKTRNETINLKNKGDVTLPASGKIVQESHIVTKEDGFQPTSTKDGIARHYEITAKAIGRTFSHNDSWTPAEGGGKIGGGSGSTPPASSEPWIMNMYWSRKPAEGTRVIIRNPKNGQTVVAVAGYETGPSTGFLLGAQEEVMQSLGASTGATVVVGFAEDQSLPLGPIDCKEDVVKGGVLELASAISNKTRSLLNKVVGQPTLAATTEEPKRICPPTKPKPGPSAGDDYHSYYAPNYGIGEDGGSTEILGKAEGLGETAYPGGKGALASSNSCHGRTLCYPKHWGGHNAINGYSSYNGDAVDISMTEKGLAYATFSGTASSHSFGNRSDLIGIRLVSDDGKVVSDYVHVTPTKTGKVRAGESIGRLYPLSGPHIHFEMSVNGSIVHGDSKLLTSGDNSHNSAYVRSLWRNMKKVLGL